MQADTHTIKNLFQKEVRYLIPTFQRPYVWNQADQWEPLWEDVRNTTERYLEELDECGDATIAHERTGSHFLGAIVLKQRMTPAASLEERDVIDGQQRMTTVQLLVDAAQDALETLGMEGEASRLNRLVLNVYADGDEVFKLWPTIGDQDAFRAAMTNGAPTGSFDDKQIVRAHEFFKLQVTEWVEAVDNESERERRAHGLETALFGLFEMVVIDLESSDDAFVIFETLNARGTPLLASDLVKNLIMQTAAAKGLDPDDVHAKHWAGLEDNWWRAEVRQGRIVRPRVDTLLDYWLEMRLHDEVASHEVFPRFRQHLRDCDDDVVGVLQDLARTAAAWQALDKFERHSPEEIFVYRWRTIEAGPVTPLVLRLMLLTEDGTLTRDRLIAAFGTIESFLVRRMVCRMTTKDYNRLFLEALRRMDEGDAHLADETLARYLASQRADARLWPTDTDLEGALADLPLYRLLTRARLRLVLESIENQVRSPKTEDQHVTRGLTIEHVMPQKWRAEWPAPQGDDPATVVLERERLIHTVGNLTLVTGSLNPSLSNGSWEKKAAGLGEHAVLLMTRQLLEGAADGWDDAKIRSRSRRLASEVAHIWPRPDLEPNLEDDFENPSDLSDATGGMVRAIWPLPGGTARMKETLDEMLAHVAATSPSQDDAIDWLLETYPTVKSTKSAKGYWSVPRSFGLVETRMGRIILSAAGEHYVARPDATGLVAQLRAHVLGMSDLLELLAAPRPLDDLMAELERRLETGWKTDAQVRWRLQWLAALGQAEVHDGVWGLATM
jgi:hypothetical protein